MADGDRAVSAPLEPPPSEWHFPDPSRWPGEDLVGLGADLEPGTLLEAYRTGLFPMPLQHRRRRVLAWWSPDPRGVLPLDGLRVSRSLRAATRRFEVRVDTAFGRVIRACADPRRPHGWLSPELLRAYLHLHELGWAHSIEAWDEQGRLCGGLYGVAIGGLFAGESMWHDPQPHGRDASKVALVGLVELLHDAGQGSSRLLDVQWQTPHLTSLGTVAIPRTLYLARLSDALSLPQPAWPPPADV